MTDEVRQKLGELPDSPGCYIMKSQGQVIYVGKAVNLKNRVSQYFHQSGHAPKVQAMVDKVDDFDVVLVNSELEALILECNLIKRYRPWYNIRLKDDKHYPYLRVDLREDFPRVELVRESKKDGARYFGPYPGATVVREMLDVVRLVFPIRTCNRAITPGKILRPCVHYEIGQCLGPCAGHATREEYHALIARVVEFLSGNFEPALRDLNARMREAALGLHYERASVYRDRIRAVEQVMQKQKAIVAGGGDQDVLAVAACGNDAVVQAMTVRGGKMIGSEAHVLERAGDEPPERVLTSFMLQYYGEDAQPPREILTSVEPEEGETLRALLAERRGGALTLATPKRGEKRQLVELALKNGRNAAEKREQRARNSYARTEGALQELREALEMVDLPERIEAYDISNTGGNLSVASMVVMKHGQAANRDYRRFRIKTVEGANDFASMHEVVSRRFKHGLAERDERMAEGLPPSGGKFSELPDLVLIDGGRGQLNAALQAMEELGLSIPTFGLAKRIEEIILPDREESILLDRHSPALHLIQRLRDEAHRFAITYHRSLRGSASLKSQLEGIPGVGPVRRRALMQHFPSLEAIRSATIEQLCEVPGVSTQTAAVIQKHLNPDKQ
ncbi:MAG: excinuclease ABC subunit UvrC [Clostridiales bacterium]|nr:excinuclease ABC subunit UvrC [Clostridiales bacterium]